MYMHYSPKKLLMTLTCIDIYACNIVSRTKSTSTFQNYCIYLSNLLLITQIFIENSEDKRQSLQGILKSWDTKTSPKRINLKICKEPKGNLDYLKKYINTDSGLQELV